MDSSLFDLKSNTFSFQELQEIRFPVVKAEARNHSSGENSFALPPDGGHQRCSFLRSDPAVAVRH